MKPCKVHYNYRSDCDFCIKANSKPEGANPKDILKVKTVVLELEVETDLAPTALAAAMPSSIMVRDHRVELPQGSGFTMVRVKRVNCVGV